MEPFRLAACYRIKFTFFIADAAFYAPGLVNNMLLLHCTGDCGNRAVTRAYGTTNTLVSYRICNEFLTLASTAFPIIDMLKIFIHEVFQAD